MGSAASRAASRQTVKSTEQALTKNSAASKPNNIASKPSVANTVSIPSGYDRRTTSDSLSQKNKEWGDLLTKVSGVISTTSWDDADELLQSKQNQQQQQQQQQQEHAAKRSKAQVSKLPMNRKAETHLGLDASGMIIRKKGSLTAEDVLEFYQLNREDKEKWNVQSLSTRFNLDEKDVSNLLKFSRTYKAKKDIDGTTRGYYDPNPSNPIKRFESW